MDPHEGRDSSSVVRTVIDENRQLVELELHESWRSRLGEDALGAAVLEAIRAAKQDWATAAEQRLQDYHAPNDNSAIDGATGFDTEGALETLARMTATLGRAIGELDQLERRAADRRATEAGAASVSGPREVITANLSAAGEISSLDIDRRWLRGVPRELLAEELLATVQNAQRAADPSQQLTDGLDALGELGSMTADPRRLIRAAGFVAEQGR